MLIPTADSVHFRVQRWPNCRIDWHAPALCRLPLQFAVGLPVVSEDGPPPASADQCVELIAERYGGQGLRMNGGGVRCGNLGTMQVKGIGANLLAGEGTDFWHRHGALSLQDAVRETIWGELIHHALPFGAVRAGAVLTTGTRFAVEVGEEKAPGWVPRALLVRELALRPAHFMRSVFFRPSAATAHLPSDAARTRDACGEALPHLRLALSAVSWTNSAAPGLPNISADGAAAQPSLGDCWREVWRRAAWQLAAACAKRLMHGTLTASNIAVDGRWLDFGTCTALRDHGRAIVAVDAKDLWSQDQIVLAAIDDLAFYQWKYLDRPAYDALAVAQWPQLFKRTYEARLAMEFAKLSGIPESLLLGLNTALVRSFSLTALRVARQGTRRPYLYFGGGSHPMPTRSGRNDLSAALRTLAILDSQPDANEALAKDVLDEPLRGNLIASFFSLRTAALATSSAAARPSAAISLADQCKRANTPLDALFRHTFDSGVDAVVRAGGSVRHHIDDVLTECLPLVADSRFAAVAPPFTA